MFRDFITALQFLTVFTVKKDHELEEGDLARSMVYFPLVGFLIGFVMVYSDKVLQWLFPDTIVNICLLIIPVLLTRALHIDGLADTADGLMGGRDPESRLAIMKDSRIGTAGLLAVVFVVLLKYVSLNNLFSEHKTAALLTAPAFARWSQMLMMFKAEYGREDGTGSSFVGHLRSGGLGAASAVTVGLSAFVIYRYDMQTAILAIALPLVIAFFTFAWRWYMTRKLGGVTGDTIGAASELNETLTLLLFVFLLSER